jgi:hypothetical protein
MIQPFQGIVIVSMAKNAIVVKVDGMPKSLAFFPIKSPIFQEVMMVTVQNALKWGIFCEKELAFNKARKL